MTNRPRTSAVVLSLTCAALYANPIPSFDPFDWVQGESAAAGSTCLSESTFATYAPGTRGRYLNGSFWASYETDSNVVIRYSNASPTPAVIVVARDTFPDGRLARIVLPPTGGPQSYATIREHATQMPVGEMTDIYLAMLDSGSATSVNVDWFCFTRKPNLTVLYPRGGERLVAGASYLVSWTYGYADTVSVDFSADSGLHWEPVGRKPRGPYAVSTDTIRWQAPDTASTRCLIRATTVWSRGSVQDLSDSCFEVHRQAPYPCGDTIQAESADGLPLGYPTRFGFGGVADIPSLKVLRYLDVDFCGGGPQTALVRWCRVDEYAPSVLLFRLDQPDGPIFASISSDSAMIIDTTDTANICRLDIEGNHVYRSTFLSEVVGVHDVYVVDSMVNRRRGWGVLDWFLFAEQTTARPTPTKHPTTNATFTAARSATGLTVLLGRAPLAGEAVTVQVNALDGRRLAFATGRPGVRRVEVRTPDHLPSYGAVLVTVRHGAVTAARVVVQK